MLVIAQDLFKPFTTSIAVVIRLQWFVRHLPRGALRSLHEVSVLYRSSIQEPCAPTESHHSIQANYLQAAQALLTIQDMPYLNSYDVECKQSLV